MARSKRRRIRQRRIEETSTPTPQFTETTSQNDHQKSINNPNQHLTDLSPQGILSLQRSHGNQFVQRFLAGKSAGVQRTTKQHLSPTFREAMGGILGEEFGNVDVVESDVPKQHNAPAFAEGDTIHVDSERYDSESDGGRELLGHELTHVAQQRQGKVLTTGYEGGYPVNDDLDLEAEADAVGTQAAKISGMATSKGQLDIGPSQVSGAGGTSPRQFGRKTFFIKEDGLECNVTISIVGKEITNVFVNMKGQGDDGEYDSLLDLYYKNADVFQALMKKLEPLEETGGADRSVLIYERDEVTAKVSGVALEKSGLAGEQKENGHLISRVKAVLGIGLQEIQYLAAEGVTLTNILDEIAKLDKREKRLRNTSKGATQTLDTGGGSGANSTQKKKRKKARRNKKGGGASLEKLTKQREEQLGSLSKEVREIVDRRPPQPWAVTHNADFSSADKPISATVSYGVGDDHVFFSGFRHSIATLLSGEIDEIPPAKAKNTVPILGGRVLADAFNDFVTTVYLPFLEGKSTLEKFRGDYKPSDDSYPKFIADKYYAGQGMHCTPVHTEGSAVTLNQSSFRLLTLLAQFKRPEGVFTAGNLNTVIKILEGDVSEFVDFLKMYPKGKELVETAIRGISGMTHNKANYAVTLLREKL